MNEPKKKRKRERTKTPNPRVPSTPLVGINGAAGGGKANKAGPMTCLVPRWNNQSGKQSSMESLEERNSYMVELMKHEERKGGEGRAGVTLPGAWGAAVTELDPWWSGAVMAIFASEAA